MERDSDVQEMVVSCYISTHTLTWSVTGTPSAALLVYLYFNSHAHVERDIISDFINWNNGISTHTLTWSVTEMFSYFVNKFGISTHTLTWSVTR